MQYCSSPEQFSNTGARHQTSTRDRPTRAPALCIMNVLVDAVCGCKHDRRRHLSCTGEGLPMALAGLRDGQALLCAIPQALCTVHLCQQLLEAFLHLRQAPSVCQDNI